MGTKETLNPATDPTTLAKRYSLDAAGRLLAIGTFDERVTVLRQQRRALNLAWAMIESRQIPTLNEDPIKIAIVGAGFAGLTFAAALLQKRCNCEITIFEERDTLLPLQQGSDTRWLHPHIYDWPEDGSEAAAAMLPVLNWTAARASDVVVQVMSSWKTLVEERPNLPLKLYCNTRHLQVQSATADGITVEWVGEQRASTDGNALTQNYGATGQSQPFELVILAVGFGLELSEASYWRNEVLGQPSLNQPRRSFLISGQGDGAMIDLLRLKISQFRQDRILTELFADKERLLSALKKLRSEYLAGNPDYPLFDKFDQLQKVPVTGPQMSRAIEQLRKRLRRDTEIVLQLKLRNISELLQPGTSRISFQNAVLVYLLYRAGGFAPSAESEGELVSRFAISAHDVIRRHGTDRIGQLARLLPTDIAARFEEEWASNRCEAFKQSSEILWSGGYFGVPGRLEDAQNIKDKDRKIWRKEYLPGPTSLIGLSIASAVAGTLKRIRPDAHHFRVTMHRTLMIHDEELLQQMCGYVGRVTDSRAPTSGRTFPATNATIGLAYRTRKIVRSRSGITPGELGAAMARLKLNSASREMAEDVGFVAAIPIVQPDVDSFSPSPVCGVVYFDSRDEGFDLTVSELRDIAVVIAEIVRGVERDGGNLLDRIDNTPLRAKGRPRAPGRIPRDVADDLVIADVSPPGTAHALVLNFDHSDLKQLA